MGSEGFALWGMLFLGLLAGCVVLIIGMFVSMIRMDIGDERRQLLWGKAPLFLSPASRDICCWKRLSQSSAAQRMEVNPFSVLTAMAVIFTLALAWNKHKYGG